MADQHYDAVIVGAGIAGAFVAQELAAAGKRVLILEAGRAMGVANEDFRSYEVYRSYVEHYQAELMKVPNSPYPNNASAPSPYATDNVHIDPGTPDLNGYWVQQGPDPFMSSYMRQQGGTTLHWMGSCPRMLPSDFEMEDTFGVARDWPIGYDDLADDYARAEWEVGVAASVEDQSFYGITFPSGYEYPMDPIPNSYSDQWLDRHVKRMGPVAIGDSEIEPWVGNLPVARNTVPTPGPLAKEARGFPWDRPELVHELGGRLYYRPQGAVGAPHIGLRCEGNSSCTPICPVQAKYSALKTLARVGPTCEIRDQCIATTLSLDENGRISGLDYVTYVDEGTPSGTGKVTADLYVLAAHAVENAKILLASGVANSSDQVGRNLMDHPYFMTWALAPENIGAFRGPGYTSGIPAFRDGEFRRQLAGFRLDVGNWGWNFSAFAPGSDVAAALQDNVVGPKLRARLADTVPRQFRMGFQIEQLPEPGNRVTISNTYKDAMGLHRPVIDYRVSDYTLDAMLAAIDISGSIFDALGIGNEDGDRFHLGQNAPFLATYRKYKGTELAFYGAGHIMGTHRMGVSPTDSVVDSNQRSWDHDNLYVVGCGSMPTVGSANPTLTAVALSLRSARDMLSRLK